MGLRNTSRHSLRLRRRDVWHPPESHRENPIEKTIQNRPRSPYLHGYSSKRLCAGLREERAISLRAGDPGHYGRAIVGALHVHNRGRGNGAAGVACVTQQLRTGSRVSMFVVVLRKRHNAAQHHNETRHCSRTNEGNPPSLQKTPHCRAKSHKFLYSKSRAYKRDIRLRDSTEFTLTVAARSWRSGNRRHFAPSPTSTRIL